MTVGTRARADMCRDVIGSNLLRAECCCSIGRGWGEVQGFCEACPTNNTRRYIKDNSLLPALLWK